MASQQNIHSDTGDSDLPVACSLAVADLAIQGRHWKDLLARAMSGRTETADGLRVAFRADPGVEDELRRLAAVESQCCRWATWTVEAGAGQVVLAVRAAGDGITALHGMFTPARRVHRR